MKKKFDKKEKSIFELDKLFKSFDKNAEIANKQAIEKMQLKS
ncbi:hypothetical protein [Candidatus Ruthia endofausta]|nr:hypothetical protein [Candidatus Ruthia endofausta]